jgi:hypothetical protein
LKKKIGFGLFRLYEESLRPRRDTVLATGATIPHNHKVPGIKNNLVPI